MFSLLATFVSVQIFMTDCIGSIMNLKYTECSKCDSLHDAYQIASNETSFGLTTLLEQLRRELVSQ